MWPFKAIKQYWNEALATLPQHIAVPFQTQLIYAQESA